MNLVMSKLKRRSGNCVKWLPPKKDGRPVTTGATSPNLILCRSLFLTDSKLTEKARFIHIHLVAFRLQLGDNS